MAESERTVGEATPGDERVKPAIGLVADGWNHNEVAGSIVRAQNEGFDVIVGFASSPGDELLEFARRLGAAVLEAPGSPSRGEGNVEQRLTQTARESGYSGLILQKRGSRFIDYDQGVKVLHRSDSYAIDSATEDLEKSTVIGIPAYNEEATIGSVVLDANRHGDEVVVVDDGSTDRTVELAEDAGATVLKQPENGGKGTAIRRAFEFARDEDVSQLVLLDGDWQHDPVEIPDLLEPIETTDADIVIGSRYIEGARGDTPLHRRVGQKLLDAATYLGSGTEVTDSQSGYRAFSRNAIEQLDLQAEGFGVETEMLRSATDNDLQVTEVPITVNYDVPDANTSNPFVHGFHVVDTFLSIVRDRHPLLFFGVPGLVLIALGLGYGAWTVSLYQTGSGFYIGKALFSAVLFIIGTFAVFSALIMNMLSGRLE